MGKSSVVVTVFIAGLLACLVACTEKEPVPKPYCYLKREFPKHKYFNTFFKQKKFSFQFDLNSCYYVGDYINSGQKRFFYFQSNLFINFETQQNIDLLPFSAVMEMHSFTFMNSDSLRKLIKLSNDLVNEDKIKADSTPFIRVLHPDDRVFGTLWYLHGDVANNFRFHITDSANRFVMGNVSFKWVRPNYDSLRPTLDYLKVDLDRMMKSFKWVK